MKEVMMTTYKATSYDKWANSYYGGFVSEEFATKEKAIASLIRKGRPDSSVRKVVYFANENGMIEKEESEREEIFTKGDYENSTYSIKRAKEEIEYYTEEIAKVSKRTYKKEETRNNKIAYAKERIEKAEEIIAEEEAKIANYRVDNQSTLWYNVITVKERQAKGLKGEKHGKLV